MTEYFLLWKHYYVINPEPEGVYDCFGEWHYDSNIDGDIVYTASLGEISETDASLVKQYANSFKWAPNTEDNPEARMSFDAHFNGRVIFTDDINECDNIEGREAAFEDVVGKHYISIGFLVRTLDEIDRKRFVETVGRFADDEKSTNPQFACVREIMRRCQQVCKDGFDEGTRIVLQAELDAEAKHVSDVAGRELVTVPNDTNDSRMKRGLDKRTSMILEEYDRCIKAGEVHTAAALYSWWEKKPAKEKSGVTRNQVSFKTDKANWQELAIRNIQKMIREYRSPKNKKS